MGTVHAEQDSLLLAEIKEHSRIQTMVSHISVCFRLEPKSGLPKILSFATTYSAKKCIIME